MKLSLACVVVGAVALIGGLAWVLPGLGVAAGGAVLVSFGVLRNVGPKS